MLVEKRFMKYPLMYWSIPLLGLIGFLEETSFGHSFLYYDVPTIRGVKIDALHDFLRVFLVMLQSEDNGLLIAMVIVGLSLFVVGFWSWLRHGGNWLTLKQLGAFPSLQFMGICIGFLFLSTVLDLEFLPHHFFVFLEEFMEATASLSLVFAYLSLKSELSSA